MDWLEFVFWYIGIGLAVNIGMYFFVKIRDGFCAPIFFILAWPMILIGFMSAAIVWRERGDGNEQ